MIIVNIKGKVTKIFPIEQKTDKFSIRKFIVEVSEKEKSNKYLIQTTNSRCSFLEMVKTGDTVSVDSELISKEYTSQKTGENVIFISLNAFKIDCI